MVGRKQTFTPEFRAEAVTSIDFITPHTHNFCTDCNRLHVTAAGTLHICLGHEDATDLKAILRNAGSNDEIGRVINDAIGRKLIEHNFVLGVALPTIAS